MFTFVNPNSNHPHKEFLEDAWDKLQLGLTQNIDLAIGNEAIYQPNSA
jgi:hypothetical protein